MYLKILLCFMLWCFSSLPSLNLFGHSGHQYSLFRCVFTCPFKSQGYLYDRIHFPAKHLNLCLLCTILCCLSALTHAKVLAHFMQEYLWLVWLFLCTFLALGLVNDFLQISHTNGIDLCITALCRFYWWMLQKVWLQDATMHLNQYLGLVWCIPWVLTLKVAHPLEICLDFNAFTDWGSLYLGLLYHTGIVTLTGLNLVVSCSL